MPAKLCLLILLGLCVLLSAEELAANEFSSGRCPFTIRLLIEENRLIRDEPFLMRIVVEGVDDAAVEIAEESETFHQVFLEKRRETVSDLVLEQGELRRRETKRVVFDYSLSAKLSGEILLPRFTVASGECRSSGPEARITAHEPVKAAPETFQVMISKNLLYVHEVAELTGVLRIPEGAEITAMHIPFLKVPGFRLHAEKSFPLAEGMPFSLSVSSMKLAASRKLVHVAGEPCQEIRFRVPFVIDIPGRFAVPNASVRYRVTGGGGRAVVESQSEAMEVQVLPLPEQNRPERFDPLVGSYTLQATADLQRVFPGQAVTVTATLSGTGRLQLSDPGCLWRSEEWRESFEIPREFSPPERTDEGLRIVQTVRPRHPAVKRIPPLEVTYFDPQTGAYTRAQSRPIALHVDLPPDVGLIVGAVGSGAQPPGAPSEKESLGESAQVAQIFADPVSGGEGATRFWHRIGSSPMAAVGPFGAFLCVLGFRRLWERGSFRERVRASWNEFRYRREIRALRRLSYPHPYALGLYRIVKRYTFRGMASWEAATGGEVLDRIGSREKAYNRAVLERLFHTLERLLYGPSSPEKIVAKEDLESQAVEAGRVFENSGLGSQPLLGERVSKGAAHESIREPESARQRAFPSKTPQARGGAALVMVSLCCFMTFFIVLHSPLRDRSDTNLSPEILCTMAGERFPDGRRQEPLHAQPHPADEHLAALLLERSVRNNSWPDGLLYARLACLYRRLGDAGRAVLWQRRAERLLGTNVFETVRLFWKDAFGAENFRGLWGRLMTLGLEGLFATPRFRLFAVGFYWFSTLLVCLLVTGRFKVLPQLIAHIVAGVSLSLLVLIASGDLIDRHLPLGVVTVPLASAFSGPGAAFSPATLHSLPAGTVFRVLDKLDGRIKVLTTTGDTVWIETIMAEPVSQPKF